MGKEDEIFSAEAPYQPGEEGKIKIPKLEDLTPEQQRRVREMVGEDMEGGPITVNEAIRAVLAEDEAKKNKE